MLFNKVFHLFLRPCIYAAAFDFDAFFLTEILDQFICTETLMAFLTVHQRIGKSAEMTGSYPCLWVHQDRTVNADIVRRFLNKFLPPCTFYIIL